MQVGRSIVPGRVSFRCSSSWDQWWSSLHSRMTGATLHYLILSFFPWICKDLAFTITIHEVILFCFFFPDNDTAKLQNTFHFPRCKKKKLIGMRADAWGLKWHIQRTQPSPITTTLSKHEKMFKAHYWEAPQIRDLLIFDGMVNYLLKIMHLSLEGSILMIKRLTVCFYFDIDQWVIWKWEGFLEILCIFFPLAFIPQHKY